jgi:hypothetical protein
MLFLFDGLCLLLLLITLIFVHHCRKGHVTGVGVDFYFMVVLLTRMALTLTKDSPEMFVSDTRYEYPKYRIQTKKFGATIHSAHSI